MKELTDYINIIYEDIYKSLCDVNNIYYTFTPFVLEEFTYYKINKIKHVYNGCNELSEFIIHKMKEHNPEHHNEQYVLHISKNELQNLPNIFFKELYIYVDINDKYENANASYEIWNNGIEEYKTYKYDEKEKLFNFINISVTSGEHYSISSDIFIHELTHAYEDYKLYSNDKEETTLYNKLYNTNYFDNINKLSNRIDIYERFLRNIEYVLNPHEQNAFIAQLTSLIHSKCKSIKGNNIKELYDYIYNNDKLFVNFNKLYHNFKYFINHRKEFTLLCKKYNTIYNKNYSNEQIYAKLSKEIYKFKNKLVNSILSTWNEFKYDGMIF